MTSHHAIGGPVRYDVLAQLHRPRDPDLLAKACRDLAATGLSVRDIAQALRLDVGQVEGFLAAGGEEAA